jgi:hypothetical protein
MTCRLSLLLVAALLMSCFGDATETEVEAPLQPELLRAYQAKTPNELIGGDVAMAQVGDYIMENERIRIAIVGDRPSPGPGIFGGTLVDADLVRPDARFRNGNGHDQFAEMFPFANLLVPRPESIQISIVADGSDGKAATIRVTGEGEFFLEALSLFKSPLAAQLFPNLKMNLSLQTDYILEPGKNYVRMVTRVLRTDPTPWDDSLTCSSKFECDKECPNGVVFDSDGCPVCECANDGAIALEAFEQTAAVFGVALGDLEEGVAPGMVAGDFVFFGGQNDIFGPGMGFDEEKTIFDALFEGLDPFTFPLEFDFMAASGGAVSYGYFTKGAEGGPDPQVLVPIITSSATAFATHGANCTTDADDDATCDTFNTWTYERYFVVGEGDVGSIADTMFKVRGTEVGTLSGVVMESQGEPAKNGRVFVLNNPDASVSWDSLDALVNANWEAVGSPGVLNAMDADRGLDPVEDGDFRGHLRPGNYVLVAMNEAQTTTSGLSPFSIEVGKTTVVHPVLPSPARVTYRIVDEAGKPVPAKLSFVSLMDDGSRATLDGLRRTYLGQGRLGNGVRFMKKVAHGHGEMEVEAGRYELTVSRGIEYGVSVHTLDLGVGDHVVIDATIRREVDTSGWIAGDFHLHAEPSFDSGMKLEKRMTSIVAEGVEFAIATDHDIVTNYAPTVGQMGLQDLLKTGIGVELSTLELGHFIAFPLAYNDLDFPHHGAPDWACKDGQGIMKELDEHIAPGVDGVKIMAHPRDGFIGYISQLGVDPFDGNREPDFLEEGNVLLRRSTCDFNAMEVYNSKRFDLIRTPSNREVILYNRCYDRLDEATTRADLNASCPEMNEGKPLATCPETLRFFECKQRYRRELAYQVTRDILTRTPEEQALLWSYDGVKAELNCTPSKHPDAIDPEIADLPCIFHPGTMDDWMKWLDQGLAVTITAASDSHGNAREPGMPRTFVMNPADTPRDIEPERVAAEMVRGAAQPTYGPFIDLRVGDALPGDVATIKAGEPFNINLRVQTASWFGVDRIEVYVSGVLAEVIELDHGPETIIDFEGELALQGPASDGFVSVVAMGTKKKNLFGPVFFEIPFGELQLPRVASLAFGAIPAFSLFLSETPLVPDFFPVFPLGSTNAVFLDVDGDGQWTKDGPLPAFCPRPCTPGEENNCGEGQICLEEGICSLPIEGECKTGAPGVRFGEHVH